MATGSYGPCGVWYLLRGLGRIDLLFVESLGCCEREDLSLASMAAWWAAIFAVSLVHQRDQ